MLSIILHHSILQLSLNHNLQRLNISKVPGTITSLFLKGVGWGWLVFLGVPPMLTTILLIPTKWILTISHLVHIILANMKMICISALPIMFPWNTVTLMWNSWTPRHLRSCFGLIVKMSAGFPWVIWFVGSNLLPLVAQLDTIYLMKLTLIKFWDIFKLATFFFICFFCAFNNYILFDSGFI